ncbi:glycosyltransferase family 4 protein [Epilithonimonas vandammei]|uniref:Glycosyltransferase family 1 protein n=1 Tax=Epilithonimonas vandammei TaxID=2487072 RepID=A0A3G8Y838_9FLAO|nr:glycosyltransferase family 4 protein [Epilithonimonas vandammei]AZI41120.1 glycosyltransferase family 1 protein [Epilithonimonas vandammei]
MAKLFRITTVPVSVEKLLGKQLTFMNQFYEVTAISSDKEDLERVGQELGVKTKAIEMTRKITPIQDLKSLWQMYCYLKKEKPGIVHTHTPKAGLIGMIAAKLAGTKVRLHTVAGLPLMETSGVKRRVLNLVEKLTYACATKVYPNSYGLKDFILKEKFCPPHKLKVIGNGSTNGIDTAYFDPALFSPQQKKEIRQQWQLEDGDFVWIFVGRLVKDKGINELVAAFRQLTEELNDSENKNSTIDNRRNRAPKLLLVGPLEPELDPLLPETLREMEHNKNILTVGYQKDVRPYLAAADALIFPSYREGFPNVVMQAGAMELPSIVTNINGCNEIVKNNENGMIISIKNKDQIYNALLRLMANLSLYNKMKSQAREYIVQHYDQKLIWNAILAEYRELTNK